MTRRARTVPSSLSNVHPAGRTCLVCRGPIVTGQGAYVRQDGAGATHSSADHCQPWCDRHGRTYGEAQGCPDCYLD